MTTLLSLLHQIVTVTSVDFSSENLFDNHSDESRQKDFSDSRGSPTSISKISRSSEEFVSHAMDDLSLWNRSTDSSKDSTQRFFLSLSKGSRASGIPSSGKLSSTLPEST